MLQDTLTVQILQTSFKRILNDLISNFHNGKMVVQYKAKFSIKKIKWHYGILIMYFRWKYRPYAIAIYKSPYVIQLLKIRKIWCFRKYFSLYKSSKNSNLIKIFCWIIFLAIYFRNISEFLMKHLGITSAKLQVVL